MTETENDGHMYNGHSSRAEFIGRKGRQIQPKNRDQLCMSGVQTEKERQKEGDEERM